MALVAGLHGALVSGLHGDGALAGKHAAPRVVQVRMIAAQQQPNLAAVPDPREAATQASRGKPAITPPPELRGNDPRPTAESRSASTNPWIASAADPYVDFLPRSALSAAPRPLQPVTIDFPVFVGAAERYSAPFDVLVDDTGGVVQVLSIDASLPPVLVQAVRNAFQPVTFSPGMLDGRPVRSRFRIEVTFESQPEQG